MTEQLILPVGVSIALGATVGALCRYYIFLIWLRLGCSSSIHGTFFVNLTGATAIAILYNVLDGNTVHGSELQSLAATGGLGAYTTFSSYILEAVALWQESKRWVAIIYLAMSSIIGASLATLILTNPLSHL